MTIIDTQRRWASPIASPLSSTVRLANAPRFDGTRHQDTEARSSAPVVQPLNGPYLPMNFVSSPRFGISSASIVGAMKSAEQSRLSSTSQVMSFWEFLDEAAEKPDKHLRSTSQYAADAIDYYDRITGNTKPIRVMGRTLVPHAIFKRPWESRMMSKVVSVMGHEWVLDDIYNTLKDNAKRPFPKKMNIIHGNNSTGKNMILDTLFDGIEQYSKTDEGSMYSFNWVFKDARLDDDDDFEILSPVGPNSKADDSKKGKSHPGMIPPNEVGVVIPANLNTNPIFLLPKAAREAFLTGMDAENKLPKGFNKDYILLDKLDTTSQRIYSALLGYYLQEYEDIDDEGKRFDKALTKVLSHVQVTRYDLSIQNRRGLVKIPGAETQDAQSALITPDIDWNRLPKAVKEAFRTAGIHQLRGPVAQAGRGNLFYDDMWKSRDLGRYQFLLQTAEKGIITVPTQSTGGGTTSDAVQENVDINLWGATNDMNLAQLQDTGDYYKSLSERFRFFAVGYLPTYRSALGIYAPDFKSNLQPGRAVDPYTLEAFSLWATMTSLFPVTEGSQKYYSTIDQDPDQSLFKTAKELTILQKALLYQGEDPNSFEMDPKKQSYTLKQKQILDRYLENIAREYRYSDGSDRFLDYEGSVGISPRKEASEVLLDVIRHKQGEPLTVVDLFEVLDERLKNGMSFLDERSKKLQQLGISSDDLQERKSTTETSWYNGRSYTRLSNIPGKMSGRGLMFQVKGHYKRRIRYDLQKALHLVKTDEYYIHQLRKYIEHVSAQRRAQQSTQTDNRPIPPEYREPTDKTEASEAFMQKMESVFYPDEKLGDNDRKEKRRELVTRLGEYRDTHKVDPLQNVGVVFSDLVNTYKGHDIKENRKIMVMFLRDYYRYLEDPSLYNPTKITPLNRDRVDRMFGALEHLKTQNGYHPDTIPKLLSFAFEGTDEDKEARESEAPKT